MRNPIRLLALAFIGGCLLASCATSPVGVRCTVTGVDTLWMLSASGTDSLPAIITTEWCE